MARRSRGQKPGKSTNPLTGSDSVRRGRNRQPTMQQMSSDRTIVRYRSIGSGCQALTAVGSGGHYRKFIPGRIASLLSTVGPNIVGKYATGVFKPGTSVAWEPSISPVAGGRIFCAFTDNVEVMAAATNTYNDFVAVPTTDKYNAYANVVKGISNVVSHPLWKEFTLQVPSATRRKRFDVNQALGITDLNELDRSAQCMLLVCFEGISAASLVEPLYNIVGAFVYNDVVEVEGMHGIAT